jgi:predicted GIY-YIG superfamily endonuclease
MLTFTDEELVADAQTYGTRTAWKLGSPQKYSLVHRSRKHLKSRCTEEMGPKQGPFFAGYEVYIYRFEDGSLYVGLTSAPARRHCFHLTRGVVREKRMSWKLRVVGRRMRMADAAETEKRWITLARSKGKALLNKSDGGEIGGILRAYKYSYAEVLAAAKACSSLSDFRSRSQAVYHFMYVRGLAAAIRTEMGWDVSRPVRKWTLEKCRAEAAKHAHPSDWKRASRSSYSIAQSRGWLVGISKDVGHVKKRKPKAARVATTSTIKCTYQERK